MRFLIRDSFAIDDGGACFVLVGDVLEGLVEPGMSAVLALNDWISLTVEISSVEPGHVFEGRSEVWLGFRGDADEVQLLRGTDLRGEIVEVVSA